MTTSHAHRHPIREVLDRQSRLEMLGNPDLQFTDRRHLGCLRGQRDAQLLLPTRPPQKQYELACRLVREGGAAVLFHPREREIDPR